MKRIPKRLLSGLALAGFAWQVGAITSNSGENPYHGLVERNAFGLKPMVAPPPPDVPPPAPPSKISLQGIQELFGKKQVLLKVVELGKPGEPPKERAIIMGEGDRRGALEVLRIDLEGREVEFRDSGTPVNLKLADFVIKTPAAATKAVPPPGVVPRIPTLPKPGSLAAPPQARVPTVNAAVPNFGGVQSTPTITTPTRPLRTQVPLSAEEQMVMIEVERERTREAVARGDMPPLPPTPITPAESMPPTAPPVPGE